LFGPVICVETDYCIRLHAAWCRQADSASSNSGTVVLPRLAV